MNKNKLNRNTQPTEVSAVAETIVALIASGQANELALALKHLKQHYSTDQNRAILAYQVAFQVALKRVRFGRFKKSVVLPPQCEGDLTVLKASRTLKLGDLRQTYSLLQQALDQGARDYECRQIAMGIIRRLSLKSRMLIWKFTGIGVVSIEVGRIAGAGTVCVKDTIDWTLEPRERQSVYLLPHSEEDPTRHIGECPHLSPELDSLLVRKVA